jgi:Cu/Ag efflux protein CusF
MKKALFLVAFLGLIVGVLCLSGAYAQTESAPEAAAQEVQDAYGEVVSIDTNAGSITITEYDYDKDQDVNKTYKIDKAATYENVKALNEIKAGDWVALTLKQEKDGTALATSVYVERYDLTEEEIAPAAQTAPAAPAASTTPAAPETPQEEPIE